MSMILISWGKFNYIFLIFIDEIRTQSLYGNFNEESKLSYDILQTRLLRSEINLLKDWEEMQKNVSGNTKYDISIILNISNRYADNSCC